MWQTLSSAPEGISVFKEFSVLPVSGLQIRCASTVAAVAAKGGAHLQPSFVHDSVVSRLQSSSV
jgi:hypothetical protein